MKEKTDSVYAALESGTDFDSVMAEYGEDPGMKSETYAGGYLTYAGDTAFVEEFATACEALTADGMTSGLVASDFGYHIIRRVSTLPAGEASFDDVKDDLMASMLQEAKDTAYSDQVEAWVTEANPEINTGKL